MPERKTAEQEIADLLADMIGPGLADQTAKTLLEATAALRKSGHRQVAALMDAKLNDAGPSTVIGLMEAAIKPGSAGPIIVAFVELCQALLHAAFGGRNPPGMTEEEHVAFHWHDVREMWLGRELPNGPRSCGCDVDDS